MDPRFRSPAGLWIGTSGRARTIIYNTDAIDPETDLPPSILDFTQPEWRGRVGWAPRNGSFQAFVTALRLHHRRGRGARLAGSVCETTTRWTTPATRPL